MNFDSVEDAYLSLAAYVHAFIGTRPWDQAGCAMRFFGGMAKGSQWLICKGFKDEDGGFKENPSSFWNGLDAAIYLRDDLLRSTGQRIWGLTFTLYPTGKFKIEYDYNKPEGYEDTDETIDAGAALASLQNILAGGSDNKPR